MNKNKDFYTQLKSLVLPMAFQQLMTALVSVSDTVMLGFLNQDALSAVSLAGQVQFVYTLFLFAAMAGVSIFAAQYWAINDKISVEKILGIGLKMSVLLSLPFTFGAILCPKYLRTVGISYFLLSISQIYLCIMKNCGMASKCATISSTAVVINIILNGLFIFGFDMGTIGAAFATVISKVVELAWAIAIMLKNDNIKIRMKYFIHCDEKLKSDFRKYTLPILGNEIVWGIGFTMYSVIMGHLGSDAAAANAIANIIKNLVICFSTGVANASGVILGGLLGRGELEKAKSYGTRLVKIAIIGGVFSGAIILCIIPFVSFFGTLSETAQDYLRVMLVVCSYYVIGKSVNMTTVSGIFPAGGDSKFGFACDTITMWAVVVPIGLISAFILDLPVTIVYIIINIDEIIKLPAVYKNYKKYNWVKNITTNKACAA